MDKKKINKEEIDDILTRGVSNIYPSREFVGQQMESGKKLTIYLGIDPTGPTLHLGHAIVIKKLSEFQKIGHKVVLLMGDFTAMIGDPTDKNATRRQLSHKEVMFNLKNYKKQASCLLSFVGENKAEFKFNSLWLAKMNFGQILYLSSKMTVQQMLERDMFSKRIKEGKPIFIHEFMYPLMQQPLESHYFLLPLDHDSRVECSVLSFILIMKLKKFFPVQQKFWEWN